MVKVVSSVGQAKVLGKYIYELQDNDMQNAFSYDAGDEKNSYRRRGDSLIIIKNKKSAVGQVLIRMF